ncbi:MAG: hypothetical protein M1365_16310 [Actinobacteria bacterium]|nr:hypothetical protein [Actinomycetota bacterium]
MKIFIITIAVVILYSFTVVFGQDYRQAQVNSYRLKYVCEELSATSASFFDREKYSDGYTIFKTEEGIKAIKDQLASLLSIDGSMTPLSNSYWSKNIEYKVYFYDDLGICKVYTNGSPDGEEAFTYGDFHKDDWTSYNIVISDPTVVVTINAGPPRFRLKFLDPLPDIIRSSSHEWEDR